MNRKNFVKTSVLAAGGFGFSGQASFKQRGGGSVGNEHIKISLNAYSFNRYLQEGDMDLEELLMYCAKLNFDAFDPTGYYFPNYPGVPDDEYVYQLKRKAFVEGLEISGTGVRNNFTDPDPAKRKDDVAHVKKWIRVAAKLGAPVIRVFAGRGIPEGYSRHEMNGWIAGALKECVACGKAHGVMIGVQNHNDYLKTADHVLEILRLVDSDWLGIILDVGSFSTEDPYEDIARVAPHAVSWQIKEYLGFRDQRVRTDLNKIVAILQEVNYRGYIPIETLGGDPMEKVPRFLEEVREALANG
ncbi:sugar phosphate isomerase/epimerase family protein [Fodinibius sediminis]|uniref:Sugar phosphate isomerase/epimerase n=1 Tax=Fodinibius sediminis TaxID=1214077 RepID=A0A521E9A3_9BACT|nr:sugar phosphate isomerase/epimerase family protein [Fodinibius sediminis]SMO80031.1 Sugar phosphate isomerase/epimerase [Fodinibius sediminis]